MIGPHVLVRLAFATAGLLRGACGRSSIGRLLAVSSLLWACRPPTPADAVATGPNEVPAPFAEPSEPQEPALRFVIDRELDLARMIGMFRADDPAGLASRAASMGVPLALASEVHEHPEDEPAQRALGAFVEERYEYLGRALERGRGHYRALWDAFGPVFFPVVVEQTQRPWVHNEYVCVVSAFHPGLSDWHGNIVAARYDHDEASKLRIVGHELILSDVFQIVRETYSPAEIDDRAVWAVSELTAVFILDEERFRSRWPTFPRAGSYFASSNYPQLAALEAELWPLFQQRTSFSDYVSQAVPLLRAADL